MDIKKLLEQARQNEETQRDISIDNILSSEVSEYKTSSEKFIDEVRDHLSTCINRNIFIDGKYFIDKEKFIIEQGCNCKTHIETEQDFIQFIRTLASMYKRTYDDFEVGYIISLYLQDKL